MITRTFKLCLNAGTGSAPYINVSQYDEGETWLFELYSETGERYIPTTGAIVGVKSDGHGIANTGTVDSEGRVVIAETQQMTASAGRAIYELSIDGLTHGTANFIVAVERKPTDDAVMSDSDLSLIQEAIDSAEVIVEVIGDGDPSEVIGEHVDAWLDNHPEATTTVQDGAITAPKINSTLWDKLLVNEEASGNPASFDDGADDVPVSSLKVALEPVQLGSGDPSPSNIRPIIASNGKNLYNASNLNVLVNNGITATVNGGTITLNGTATSNAYFNVNNTGSPSGTYTLSYNNPVASSNVHIALRTSSNTYYSDTTANSVNRVVTSTGEPDDIIIYVASGTTLDNFVLKPMLERGSSASPYQPYQGVTVDVVGKNLLNVSNAINATNVVSAVDGDGTIHFIQTSSVWSNTYLGKVDVIGGVTYTISANLEYGRLGFSTNTTYPTGAAIPNMTVSGGSASAILVRTRPSTQFTPSTSGTLYLFYCTDIDNSSGTAFATTIMIEVGSSASDYEPYISPTSYPYSLGQTVYGGTVDLATGVLTVTHGIVDMGTLTWVYDSTRTCFYTVLADMKTFAPGDLATYVCDSYQTIAPAYSSGNEQNNTIWARVNETTFRVRDTSYTVAADFKAAVSGHQLVYELATPTTVQLTPTQVKTLLGYNNISSSGTVEVIYHADTKLYVDKMTAVDNNIIAPKEEGFTATRNYTVNDLLIVADTLYKVTSNIQNGGTITPNSNVTATTLGALIKALS